MLYWRQFASGLTIGPENLPVYVSSITWGRMLMMQMTSVHSADSMKAALSIAAASSDSIGASWSHKAIVDDSEFTEHVAAVVVTGPRSQPRGPGRDALAQWLHDLAELADTAGHGRGKRLVAITSEERHPVPPHHRGARSRRHQDGPRGVPEPAERAAGHPPCLTVVPGVERGLAATRRAMGPLRVVTDRREHRIHILGEPGSDHVDQTGREADDGLTHA